MKRLYLIAILVALAARDGIAQPPRVPVLVELYTSEGCSSCPPADVLLESLSRDQPVARAEVVAVGLHVDYFDHLGWKDTFSSRSFTARQRSYSPVFGDDNLYTPQIVVDGEKAIPGTDGDIVRREIAAAAARPHLAVRVAARLAAARVQLTIEAPAAPTTAEKIQIVAAITEDGLSSVVTRGENNGRTLHHVAVARSVQVFDALTARSAVVEKQLNFEKNWNPGALKAVVWLQGVKSREVYGAGSARITN